MVGSHQKQDAEVQEGAIRERQQVTRVLRTTPNVENWTCKGPEVNK